MYCSSTDGPREFYILKCDLFVQRLEGTYCLSLQGNESVHVTTEYSKSQL